MGLFFIFKFIIFFNLFFKSLLSSCAGSWVTEPHALGRSLGVSQVDMRLRCCPAWLCIRTHLQPVSQAFSLPLHWPPHSGQEEARARAKFQPFEQESQPHSSLAPQAGTKPPHSCIHSCLARLGEVPQGGSFFSENLFSRSPEKQERLTKAGEAHKGRRG